MSDVIGDFQVRGRTYLREDGTGRFRTAAHKGALAAQRELAQNLATLVRGQIASMGLHRTGELIASVEPYIISATEGGAVVEADHGAPLEKGAVDHWIPNAFGSGVRVFWKGSGRSKSGYHFFRAAAEQLNARADAIVRKHMP